MLHRYMDQSLLKKEYKNALEVGSGSLEHLRFSKKIKFHSYTATDILYNDQKFVKKIQKNLKLPNVSQLKIEYGNAESLKYPKSSFDVLIATCVLIHLGNPEAALLNWKNLIKKGGELIIYVPCEPGIILRLGRRIAVSPKHRKIGIFNYPLICAREHRTSLNVLNEYIKEVFSEDRVRIHTWPIMALKAWNFNLAYVYHIKIN